MGKKIHEIEAEVDRLKDEEEMLEDKLQQRKKQFHVLVNSIHKLQELIEEEEESAMEGMVNAANSKEDEGLVDSNDDDNDADTAKDELNTSNVSSSPEDAHMEVS